VVLERAEITRLGQGVDATRRLAPEAVERTLATLARYGAEIRAAGVTAVDAVGTSAMRDAEGGAAFVARAAEAIGVAPRVVSGEEEAALTYEGALAGLSVSRQDAPTVFDVGGGSTEVIWLDRAAGAMREVSLDVGSVRLTERHVRHDPPTAAELDAVRADIRAALDALPAPGAPRELVGVAGTVTTLAAVLQELAPYDGARVHGSPLTSADVDGLVGRLAAVPLEQRQNIVGLEPKRADVIVAGALIVSEVMRWAKAPRLLASDRGVRWGLALRLARAAAP
jgi:exopolyphosphatase/guanosine-5'-triphosphate,3'-diphosphate pyrophosphatase